MADFATSPSPSFRNYPANQGAPNDGVSARIKDLEDAVISIQAVLYRLAQSVGTPGACVFLSTDSSATAFLLL